MLTFPDVSHHQGPVDMGQIARAGHVAVGIKTSEGTGYRDPLFAANRQHAITAGLIRILYHYAKPGSKATTADAIAEARWFFSCIGTLLPGEVTCLDIEDPQGRGDLSGWAMAFLGEIDRLTGRAGGTPEDDAILYSYAPYIRSHLRLNKLGARTLWLAAYSTSATAPSPWSRWTFWQWTSSGSCPGINGRCDLNRFGGSRGDLERIAGMHPVPAPAPAPKPAPAPAPAPATITSQEDPMRTPYIVTIPAPDDHGRQKVSTDSKGRALPRASVTSGVQVAARDDLVPNKVLVEQGAYIDALVLCFYGLDGGPAPTGDVKVIVEHR